MSVTKISFPFKHVSFLLYVIVFSQVPSYSVSGLLGISSISFTSFLQGIAIHINKEGLFKTTKLGSQKETRCGSPIWYARDWQIHSSRPTICGLVCKFSCFNNIGGNNGSKFAKAMVSRFSIVSGSGQGSTFTYDSHINLRCTCDHASWSFRFFFLTSFYR